MQFPISCFTSIPEQAPLSFLLMQETRQCSLYNIYPKFGCALSCQNTAFPHSYKVLKIFVVGSWTILHANRVSTTLSVVTGRLLSVKTGITYCFFFSSSLKKKKKSMTSFTSWTTGVFIMKTVLSLFPPQQHGATLLPI